MENKREMFNKNELLSKILEHLDISESNYKKAVDSYTAVGNYLAENLSEDTEIYPQGSFLYGTVTRPYIQGKDAEYDIDLVCEYSPSPDTPDACKNLCGDALRTSELYEKMLNDESRRCWTLEYAKISKADFHIDILPSKRASAERIQKLVNDGVLLKYAKTAIKITTKHDDGHYEWDDSNPKGYKAWLVDVTSLYTQEKRSLYEDSVERVPGQNESKTPVHRVIQILKRHRDIRFDTAGKNEIKPISMIITTLVTRVAEANKNKSATAFELLEMVINSASRIKALNEQNMRHDAFEETFIVKKDDGIWEILNPVDPEENFADKWHENNEEKAKAFFQWVDWLKQDLFIPLNSKNSITAFRSLSEGLGRDLVKSVYQEMALPLTNPTLNIITKEDTTGMPKPWKANE